MHQNIIYNLSFYSVAPREVHSLFISLDQHIPTKIKEKKIEAEFERFFFQVQKFIKDHQGRDELRTKFEGHVIIRNVKFHTNIKD